MKISIENFMISNESKLHIDMVTSERKHQIYFTLPERFVPSSDMIALSLTALLGQKYDEVYFDLPISRTMVGKIETLTQSKIKAPVVALPESSFAPTNYVLNFSGGFDSLAALALMPTDVKLTSLDFGGAFKREADFFRNFDTTVISTNFRKEGFAENQWTFMGVAPILLRDYFQAYSYSFGSILEGSPWNLRQDKFESKAQPIFAAAGLKMFNPLLGLTEIGAIRLLVHYSPELAKDSLKSLAAPGSEKFNRKSLLLEGVKQLQDGSKSVDLGSLTFSARQKFGDSLPADFRSLYLIKRFGIDFAELLVSEIPQVAIEFVKNLSLNFFERLNPTFTQAWNYEDKRRVYSKCLEAGIDLYTERDFAEYRSSIAFLSQWHKAVAL